jgi:protein-S-isoprenylcysteine O-methyltransferase Ste14
MSTPHSNRSELAGEHRYTDTGQLVLFAVFLIVWITDSFLIPYSVFLAVHVPVCIRLIVGISTLIASALLVLSAHKAVFGKPSRKPGVISKGAFSLVRHPMYFGSWLFSAGLVLTTFSLSSAAVSIMILIFYYLVAKHEELLLLKKFGVAYRRYQDRVPMFVPLTRRGPCDKRKG